MGEAERKNREGKPCNSGKWREITGKGEVKEIEWNEMEVIPATQRRVYGSKWSERKWRRECRTDRMRKRQLEIEEQKSDEEERKKTIQGMATAQETTKEMEEEHSDEGDIEG